MASYSNQKAYNPTEINSFLSRLDSAYYDLSEILGTEMQGQVLSRLENCWAGSTAQKHLPSVVEAWNSMCSYTYAKFLKIIAKVNNAATNMATANDENWSNYSPKSVEAKVEIDVKSEINGGHGVIDYNEYAQAYQNISTNILDGAQKALDEMERTIQNTGFLDETTEDSIINKMQKIKNKVNTTISELVDEIHNNGDVNLENLNNAISANSKDDDGEE